MIKRPPDDIRGLDDLKAAQALARRQLERHLAGKPAMIDRPTAIIQTEPSVDHWTARAMGLERAAQRLEAQNEARRRDYEARAAGWDAERRWWAIQVTEGMRLCPGKVRHLMLEMQPLRFFSIHDPVDTPIEPLPIIEKLVYCPCVVRPPHGIRECACNHGQRGGIYVP